MFGNRTTGRVSLPAALTIAGLLVALSPPIANGEVEATESAAYEPSRRAMIRALDGKTEHRYRGREMRVRRSPTGLQASFRRVGGTWSEPETIGGRQGPSGRFTYAIGPRRAAVVTYSNGRFSQRLWVQHRERGTWTEPYRLGNGSNADITIDGRGTVSVAWTDNTFRCPPCEGDIFVRTTSRRNHGNWRPVRSFEVSWGYDPAIGSNRRGGLVLAWGHGSGVAVVRKAHGRSWGKIDRITGDTGSVRLIRAGLDGRGRAVVLWGRDTEEFTDRRRYVAASNSRLDGTWTRPAYLNSPMRRGTAFGLGLIVTAGGRAFAAWQNWREYGTDEFYSARFRPGAGWKAWHPKG
jgi:hypothetical protein